MNIKIRNQNKIEITPENQVDAFEIGRLHTRIACMGMKATSHFKGGDLEKLEVKKDDFLTFLCHEE